MNALRRPAWTAVAVVGATVLAVGATCSVNENGLGVRIPGAAGAGARAEISSMGGAAGERTDGSGASAGTGAAILGSGGAAAGPGGGSAGAADARGGGDGEVGGAGGISGMTGGTAGGVTTTGHGGSSVGGAVAGAAGGIGPTGSSGSGGTAAGGAAGLGAAGGAGTSAGGAAGLGGAGSTGRGGAFGRGGAAGNPCRGYPSAAAFTPPEDGRPHCYWFHPEKQTFTTARSQCRNEGGDLVSILSKAENDWVVSIGRFTGSFPQLWIGGTDGKAAADKSGPGTYRWVTGEPWTYSNWNATSPAQPDGYCDPCSAYQSCTCDHWATIAMDGTWYDFWAENPRGFICETTADTP